MRIGIDARFLTHPQPGGFKTYSVGLINALAAVDGDNEYVLYLDRAPGEGATIPQQPNVTLRIVAGARLGLAMPWREQIGLAAQVKRDALDLLHSPSLTAPLWLSCRSVVTIHDMIWRKPQRSGHANAKRRWIELYYQYLPALSAQRAAIILTPSFAARDSIVEQLSVPAERVVVTHEAPGGAHRRIEGEEQQQQNVRRRYDLSQPFVLAIGSADPRKNLAALVQAYSQLPKTVREDHLLAIVWTHPRLATAISDQAAQLGIHDRLRFLTQVSDEDLIRLYNEATVFVFPSRYEGFGLPPLEAMACGAPVIAGNNSSLPEILGDAALLVDVEDSTQIAQSLRQLLENNHLRDTLAMRGLARARRFSWEQCARQTLAAYRLAIPASAA